MNSDEPVGPDLPGLFFLFPPESYLAGYEMVAGDQVPQPFHQLLVHTHHMTVTVEAFYGDLVVVKVLEQKKSGPVYARKILLALQKTGKIVQFGLVRISLDFCSPQVQQEILQGQTPLGRILIQHDVLRRIEPTAYLKITPGPDLMKWFGLEKPQITYGRLALIYCDHLPAVELLEIVAP